MCFAPRIYRGITAIPSIVCLLVAQAQVEDLPILTADPLMLTYDVKVLRAR